MLTLRDDQKDCEFEVHMKDGTTFNIIVRMNVDDFAPGALCSIINEKHNKNPFLPITNITAKGEERIVVNVKEIMYILPGKVHTKGKGRK